jgi:hypothetical protein
MCYYSSHLLAAGHQDQIYENLISELRPKIFELATCACRVLLGYDEHVAKESTSSSWIDNNNNSSGNNDSGESKNKIECLSGIAKYGAFRCSSHGSDVTGWYRTCVQCAKQYCVTCSFQWRSSNELSKESEKCECSYCIHRDRLILLSRATSSTVKQITIVPPRYSCKVHCRSCMHS